MGGKLADAGDTEDCGLVLEDLLVLGRWSSFPVSTDETVNALNTGGWTSSGGVRSAKLDEFCDTHLPKVVGSAVDVNTEPFSEEKES